MNISVILSNDCLETRHKDNLSMFECSIGQERDHRGRAKSVMYCGGILTHLESCLKLH